MGHEKPFNNMCQRTFFSNSGTSKLKETIKIQYYTLSIQKTYCKYQKHNKKMNQHVFKVIRDIVLLLMGETTLELDLHADTCVLGRYALIFLDYDRTVIVEGYDPSLGTKTQPTVSGALAYDDPTTGKVYHLVINQAIHTPHLDHHLLCPMQCRFNDVIVDNMPKFLTSEPTDHMHALTIRDPHQPAQMAILPLALRGVT